LFRETNLIKFKLTKTRKDIILYCVNDICNSSRWRLSTFPPTCGYLFLEKREKGRGREEWEGRKREGIA
jgi:hypothetical protein